MWTHADLLLSGTSLPPVDLFLDHTSRTYRIQILQGPDFHPNTKTLTEALQYPLEKAVGLRRIAHLVTQITPQSPQLEYPRDPTNFLPTDLITIQTTDKAKSTARFTTWLKDYKGHLLSTDQSRNHNNLNA